MSRYGAKPTGGPWTFAIRLDVEPRCPGCCEWLQACVVEIRSSWAWCPLCVSQGLHTHDHVLAGLCSIMDSGAYCITHGVCFYTPRVWMGPPRNALAYYERRLLEKSSTVGVPTNADMRDKT